MKLAHQVFPGSSGAPTLLLLHGVTRNGRDWEPLLPGLTRHWRVLVTDHCGHGNSPRSASAQPSGLATYVTAHRSSGVQNVSRKLIPKSSARWSLVAGSMGSKLGIYGRALAARHCCCKAILQQAEHSPTLQFYRLAEPCAATSTFASPEPRQQLVTFGIGCLTADEPAFDAVFFAQHLADMPAVLCQAATGWLGEKSVSRLPRQLTLGERSRPEELFRLREQFSVVWS